MLECSPKPLRAAFQSGRAGLSASNPVWVHFSGKDQGLFYFVYVSICNIALSGKK
jgi:hypothetical protein